MAMFTRTITVNAPVETVFTFMRDPAKRWDARRHLEVSDVRMTPDGVGTTHRWKGKMLGITLMGGTNTCTELVPSKRLVERSTTGPVWTWTFGPESGGTRMTVDMYDAPANWAASAVANITLKRSESALDLMLSELKVRMEAEA